MKTLARTYRLGFLSLLLVSAVLSACNGGFRATENSFDVRPPVTDDPQTSQNQRQSERDNEEAETGTPAEETPLLETPMEREGFLDDVTEKAPKHTEDELARDAEDQHQRHLQKQKEKELEQKKREHEQKQNRQDSQTNPPDSEHDDTKPKPQTPPKPPARPNVPVTPPRGEDSKKNPPAQPPTPRAEPPAPAGGVPAANPPPKPTTKEPPKPQTPAAPAKPQAPPPAKPATPPAPPAEPVKPPTQPPEPKSPSGDFCEGLNVAKGKGVADLSDLYNDDGKLEKNMPASELNRLTSQDKKNKFVCILLPIAIRMEEEVYKQRREVLRLQAKEKQSIELTAEDKQWLSDIKVGYKLTAKATYAELLARVDVIPLPLLLAQAALESGWGRSRATVDLRNLFGLHQGAKSEPCKRGYDTNNACVREFNTIGESVSAYIKLLNSGPYESFRKARAQMRTDGKAMDSDKLLLALSGKYNETPSAYVRSVREVMSQSNNFHQFIFKEEEVDPNSK